jgi:hypothetical protein
MRALFKAWNNFFFSEQSPLPLAVFRIVYGCAVTATLVLLKSDWLAWYGVHGWVTLGTMRELEPGTRLNLFALIPQDDRWIAALFWFALAAALLLTAGLFTRFSSILVYVCLVSLDQRNLYILHGGDTFLRVSAFFLMFAPAGAALSVDRLIRVWRGKEGPEIRPQRLWAQRMIQIELSLVYIVTALWKTKGAPWLNGSALFFIYHLLEFQRFPIPDFLLNSTILKLGTRFALVLEFSLGTLIWVKRIRYKVLLAGLLFHLTLEYSLNVPMFEWDILTAYVLFIDAADLERAGNWIRARLGLPFGQPHGTGQSEPTS